MNDLSNRRELLPTGERLYSWMAVGAIVIIVVGYLLFIRSSILPPLRDRSELSSQLASAEQALMEAQRTQTQAPGTLERQIENAQAALDQAASAFLSESQAADVLNKLSQYASESHVKIINLQTLTDPEKTSDVYDVRKFQLQIEGVIPSLINFVSRIQEATYQSLTINNVNIIAGEAGHALTMVVNLYTSPYASETTTQPAPPATPIPPSDILTQLDAALSTAWEAEDWEQAINLSQQIRTIDPNYDAVVEKLYAAHVNFGHQLLEQQDVARAITQFNAALSIKPEGTEALAGLQQAASVPASTLTPEERLIQLLDQTWVKEDWENVIRIIEQILTLKPNDPNMTEKLYAAYVNHGYKLAVEGQPEQAKQAFTHALDIKPDGAEAIAGLRALAEGTIPSAPVPPSQYTTYVVQRGDTLYSLARRHGTTVQAIMAANGLVNYNIRVGQELRIPVGQ